MFLFLILVAVLVLLTVMPTSLVLNITLLFLSSFILNMVKEPSFVILLTFVLIMFMTCISLIARVYTYYGKEFRTFMGNKPITASMLFNIAVKSVLLITLFILVRSHFF